MHYLKRYYHLFLPLIILVLLLQNTSCIKEYSIEGMHHDTLPPDTIVTIITPPVTTTPSVINFPQCSFCDSTDEITTGRWGFKVGNTYLCGSDDNSGFIGGPSKTAFTFFGPSACSADTGIVVSVYLPVALDQDRSNLTTNEAAFYYYHHNAPKDILISLHPSVFSVTVQSFINATGIVTGTFNGIAFTADGDTVHITEGRFKAKLH
jgi:hypothetical protein